MSDENPQPQSKPGCLSRAAILVVGTLGLLAAGLLGFALVIGIFNALFGEMPELVAYLALYVWCGVIVIFAIRSYMSTGK